MTGLRLAGQSNHADPVMVRRGQYDSQLEALLAEECVGHLNQDSSSVSRIRLGTFGAAMQHVDENLKRFANNIVGFAAVNINHKTDAATVMFKLRIVKALFGWDTR